jgi:hypothetical protein
VFQQSGGRLNIVQPLYLETSRSVKQTRQKFLTNIHLSGIRELKHGLRLLLARVFKDDDRVLARRIL